MDTELQSLLTVRDVERERRDAAVLSLRQAEQRLAQTLAQEQALQAYRRDTGQRWGTPLGRSADPTQLLVAHRFLERLDEALRQQTVASQRARTLADERRSELMAAETRVAVLDKLIERRRLEQAARRNRLEQKSLDERAQRLSSHPLATAAHDHPQDA